MKKLKRSFVILAAIAGLFAIAACTDIAEPIGISKSPTPVPPAATKTEGDEAPRISLADAKKAFDDKTATFIDTHPKAAFDAGHIPGAINITVPDLESKFDSIPKGKRIIAYCS
ncbi:MAG: rhodanese-like domain-containing protein [Pyrinomonadaceae bacterium]